MHEVVDRRRVDAERGDDVLRQIVVAGLGLSMDTKREDLTQAVLEGVAFGLRDSVEIARSLGISLTKTRICGGGAKSPLWRKIITNVMNLEVERIASEEGPGLGAAILAMVGSGGYASVEEAVKAVVKVKDSEFPDPKLVSLYEEKYRVFRTLYPNCRPVFESIK